MKFINEHKFLIACGVALLLAFFCFKFFLQAVKTDHSMELFKQQMDYQEQARQAVQKERLAWQELALQQTKTIIALQVRDSVVAAQAAAVETKIITISKPEYVQKKIQAVESLDGGDMLNYLNRLKEPNDY